MYGFAAAGGGVIHLLTVTLPLFMTDQGGYRKKNAVKSKEIA